MNNFFQGKTALKFYLKLFYSNILFKLSRKIIAALHSFCQHMIVNSMETPFEKELANNKYIVVRKIRKKDLEINYYFETGYNSL